jgi:protease-4
MRYPLALRTVTLAALALAGCSVISVDLTPRLRPLDERTVEGTGDAKIILLDVSGFLSDEAATGTLTIGSPPPRLSPLARLREQLLKAEKDSRVKALVLRINSPGGTVTASDIMFQELDLYRQRTRQPVVAVLMDVAASGGYYVALAADTIVAHPTTVTGSIGVVMVSVDARGLLDKLGVSTATIKSGALKDMGSPFRPLAPEERTIFQTIIDGLYTQFVGRVVERRRLPEPAARALADGRVYTAEQALRHGLIDRIGYMPDALAVARNAIGVTEARVVVYHRPREYRATYYARSESATGGLESSLGRLLPLAGPGPQFLYLWSP